jgi:hypothetical protein
MRVPADAHLNDRALSALDEMADWSEWVPFGEALASAPLVPGVYMAREGTTGPIVYVGMAGERAGRTGTGTPKGLRGRLGVYVSGKGLASGLGEAVMDRALADPGWLRERLAEAEAGEPLRAKAWGRAAFVRAQLHLRWTTTPDKARAAALERRVLAALADADLWNRRR